MKVMTSDTTFSAWGGFRENELDIDRGDGAWDEARYAIFATKRAAKRAYEDVRPIKVVVSAP